MEGGRKGSWKERDIEWGKSSDIWHHDLTHARERDERLSTSWGFSNLLVLSLSLTLTITLSLSFAHILSLLPNRFLFYPYTLSLLPNSSLSLSFSIHYFYYTISFISLLPIVSLSLLPINSLLPKYSLSYPIIFIALLPILSLSLCVPFINLGMKIAATQRAFWAMCKRDYMGKSLVQVSE